MIRTDPKKRGENIDAACDEFLFIIGSPTVRVNILDRRELCLFRNFCWIFVSKLSHNVHVAIEILSCGKHEWAKKRAKKAIFELSKEKCQVCICVYLITRAEQICFLF